MGGRFEVVIAFSASTALGNEQAVIRSIQILEQRLGFGIDDQGSCRNLDHYIGAVFSGLVSTLTRPTVRRLKMAFELKWIQGSQLRRASDDHIAAPAAVAAVRSAAGDVFFAPKADTSAPAIAGLDGNNRIINKFHSA
jgi:hypothetical protein